MTPTLAALRSGERDGGCRAASIPARQSMPRLELLGDRDALAGDPLPDRLDPLERRLLLLEVLAQKLRHLRGTTSLRSSFFDRAMSDHEEACADAWRLVLRFMAVPAD